MTARISSRHFCISPGVALWQASVAREQARVAREEAQRADAVQSFLVGVFDSNSSYQDDPVKARATTAEQLLALGKQKIDGAIALMMAVGRVTTEDETQAGLDRFLSDPIL